MSILSKKTGRKAITVVARMAKMTDKLHYLEMSKEDDKDVTQARNLLQAIIQSNGYRLNYGKNSKQLLTKIQHYD